MILKEEQLITLKGGSVSASFLNSISRFINTILNLGQILGELIGRAFGRKICKR